MPTKPPSLSKRILEIRGGRASDDRAYRVRRLSDPFLAQLERLRHTAEWQRTRQAVLNRDRGLCVLCRAQGRTTRATDVDHIVPARVNLETFYAIENLQSLCHPCHDRKSRAEARGGSPHAS